MVLGEGQSLCYYDFTSYNSNHFASFPVGVCQWQPGCLSCSLMGISG